MAQHTIYLPCIADTYISAENPNSNYGASSILNAGGYIGYTIPGTTNRFLALLKFDWTSVPIRKNALSIKIKAYSTKALAGTANSNIRYGLSFYKGFTENTETFYSYDEDSASMVGGALDGVSIPLNAWVEFGELISIYNGTYKNKLIDNGVCFAWDDWPNGAWSSEYWQVQSREGANPPVLSYTYEDVPPSKSTLNSPVGSFESNNAIIRFSWNYISSVGGSQAKFDLQWSTDQATWNTISQTTTNTYCDLAANTLPAGNIYWKVQTYNEYDEASGYSDIAAFYAIGAPSVPIIQSVSNATRPTITWSSSNQQVYQIQVLQGETVIHDSGLLPGISARSYKVTDYLADGSYTARVRIKNEYDLYSDWGESDFTLTITRPLQPVISLVPVLHGIQINVTNILSIESVYIYRSEAGKNNFICIGEAVNGVFVDYGAASGTSYDYFARAIFTDTISLTNVLTNGSFESDFTGFTQTGGAYQTIDTTIKKHGAKSLKIDTGATPAASCLYKDIAFTNGHIIYTCQWVYFPSVGKASSTGRGLIVLADTGGNANPISTQPNLSITDQWQFISTIKTVSNGGVRCRSGSTSSYTGAVYVDCIMVMDLTALFGAGNEPTKIYMDDIASKYFNGYFDGTVSLPEEAFTDSVSASGSATLKNNLFAPASDLSDITELKYNLNNIPGKSSYKNPISTSVLLSGRQYPVTEFSEHDESAMTFNFAEKDNTNIAAIQELIDLKETVLFRDGRGRKMFGTLSSYSDSDVRKGTIFSFTLSQTDYSEEVEG